MGALGWCGVLTWTDNRRESDDASGGVGVNGRGAPVDELEEIRSVAVRERAGGPALPRAAG
jgi:hypothetical protein